MTDKYDVGSVTATQRADGSVLLDVTGGPLRISRKLAAEASGQFLTRDDDVITISGVWGDGTPRVLRYRVSGEELFGPEDGWLLCEPLP